MPKWFSKLELVASLCFYEMNANLVSSDIAKVCITHPLNELFTRLAMIRCPKPFTLTLLPTKSTG